MSRIRKFWIIFILTLICLVAFGAYRTLNTGKNQDSEFTEYEKQATGTDAGNKGTEATPTDSSAETEDSSNYVTLVALGQNYMNDSVIHSGMAADGSYNYSFLFEKLAPYLQKADIAALCTGGLNAGNALGISGYPVFNAPEEFCAAAVASGINTVALANVRINNLGSDAITSCLNIWKNASPDMNVLGVHESAEEPVVITEIHGLKIAMLDFTAIMEKSMADDKTYQVDFFGNYQGGAANLSGLSEKTLAKLDEAQKSADFVVVFASWGVDDTTQISAFQKRIALQLTEAGADLIIGYRTNQLQTVEWVQADNGNRALCYYSLGNFVSSEHAAANLVGGMATVGIKVENGLTVIDEEKTGLIPLVMQYAYPGTGEEVSVTATIPLRDYTDEIAQNHGMKVKYGKVFDTATVKGILDAVVSSEWIRDPS